MFVSRLTVFVIVSMNVRLRCVPIGPSGYGIPDTGKLIFERAMCVIFILSYDNVLIDD